MNVTASEVNIETLVLGREDWRLLDRSVMRNQLHQPHEVKRVPVRGNKNVYRFEQTRPTRQPRRI